MSTLSEFRPRAAIFDLDGTLVDNMAWHAQAFDAFVSQHALPAMTMATRKRIDGKRNLEIFPILFERDMTADEIRVLEEEKEGTYRTLSAGGLVPMAGLVRLIDRLDAHGVQVAVATSSPAANVRHTLEETGLAARFPIIARGDQVPRGKPFPDVFLHAASLLGVEPGECLAFEDAPLGIEAARSAGMRCIAITTTFPAEAFARPPAIADATYRDFDAYLAGAGQWLLSGNASTSTVESPSAKR